MESQRSKISFHNIFHRIKYALRNEGLRVTLLKIYTLLNDRLFDIRYGLDTCNLTELEELTITSENKDRGVSYQPSRVIPLKKLFSEIRPYMPADSVFVDFGCGKGRVLLIAKTFGFSEVRGIEFASELCEIARKNCSVFETNTGLNTPCRIIEADVTTYSINPDENVFFLFNPFDEEVLQKVISGISNSLKFRHRKVLIIYHFPKFINVFDRSMEYERLQDFDFWGYKFTVYSNIA
ncbi:MAG: hypothetical protein CVU14_11285 [Bacteroidetes bacterium HGW-Bacteroidetes-9]|jgi:SAM-dependent methyltransferase|nr:MAG: hypothetical protein CVU14_11285 [Bacteroidetes bacterium HGW-Bacteroidetes-9]